MRTIYEAKLLLIDDNPDLIQLLYEQLNHAGYIWIQTASNCEEARTAFSKQRPNCMILDINLPDGDGFSLFRELRAQADIPTLFLSARDNVHIRHLREKIGENVGKPAILSQCAELVINSRRLVDMNTFAQLIRRYVLAAIGIFLFLVVLFITAYSGSATTPVLTGKAI